MIGLGGTQAEELTQHHLERVGLQGNQEEQQSVRAVPEGAGPPAPLPPPAAPTGGGPVAGVGPLVGRLERRQEVAELRGGQAGHSQEGARLSR